MSKKTYLRRISVSGDLPSSGELIHSLFLDPSDNRINNTGLGVEVAKFYIDNRSGINYANYSLIEPYISGKFFFLSQGQQEIETLILNYFSGLLPTSIRQNSASSYQSGVQLFQTLPNSHGTQYKVINNNNGQEINWIKVNSEGNAVSFGLTDKVAVGNYDYKIIGTNNLGLSGEQDYSINVNRDNTLDGFSRFRVANPNFLGQTGTFSTNINATGVWGGAAFSGNYYAIFPQIQQTGLTDGILKIVLNADITGIGVVDQTGNRSYDFTVNSRTFSLPFSGKDFRFIIPASNQTITNNFTGLFYVKNNIHHDGSTSQVTFNHKTGTLIFDNTWTICSSVNDSSTKGHIRMISNTGQKKVVYIGQNAKINNNVPPKYIIAREFFVYSDNDGNSGIFYGSGLLNRRVNETFVKNHVLEFDPSFKSDQSQFPKFWIKNKSYKSGDLVAETNYLDNYYVWKCLNDGTSSSIEPLWREGSYPNFSKIDNDITWTGIPSKDISISSITGTLDWKRIAPDMFSGYWAPFALTTLSSYGCQVIYHSDDSQQYSYKRPGVFDSNSGLDLVSRHGAVSLRNGTIWTITGSPQKYLGAFTLNNEAIIECFHNYSIEGVSSLEANGGFFNASTSCVSIDKNGPSGLIISKHNHFNRAYQTGLLVTDGITGAATGTNFYININEGFVEFNTAIMNMGAFHPYHNNGWATISTAFYPKFNIRPNAKLNLNLRNFLSGDYYPLNNWFVGGLAEDQRGDFSNTLVDNLFDNSASIFTRTHCGEGNWYTTKPFDSNRSSFLGTGVNEGKNFWTKRSNYDNQNIAYKVISSGHGGDNISIFNNVIGERVTGVFSFGYTGSLTGSPGAVFLCCDTLNNYWEAENNNDTYSVYYGMNNSAIADSTLMFPLLKKGVGTHLRPFRFFLEAPSTNANNSMPTSFDLILHDVNNPSSFPSNPKNVLSVDNLSWSNNEIKSWTINQEVYNTGFKGIEIAFSSKNSPSTPYRIQKTYLLGANYIGAIENSGVFETNSDVYCSGYMNFYSGSSLKINLQNRGDAQIFSVGNFNINSGTSLSVTAHDDLYNMAPKDFEIIKTSGNLIGDFTGNYTLPSKMGYTWQYIHSGKSIILSLA